MQRVFPHPDLAKRNEYLPGIGEEGAELPDKEADDLVKRGLAVKAKSEAPAKPAEKPEE